MTKEQILIDALKKAVEVIKQWHGAEVFDIYYAHAPEMKLIREALSQYNEGVVPEPEQIKSFLPLLEENYQATKQMHVGNMKQKYEKDMLLETYEDLIAIYKSKYHPHWPAEGKGEEKEVDKP